MRAPSSAELAAIAVAYLAVSRREPATAAPQASRWRIAGRLPHPDPQSARFVAASASRWNAAGRLDG